MAKTVIDLTGKIFGNWKVKERASNSKGGMTRWICECSCKRTTVPIVGAELTLGRAYRCRLCAIESRRLNLKGKTYGRLYITTFAHVIDGKAYWNCTCSCIKHITLVVASEALVRGLTTSCGCYKQELRRPEVIEHSKQTGLSLPDAHFSLYEGSSIIGQDSMIGQTYGKLTIIGSAGTKNTERMYWCKCSCNKDSLLRVRGSHLRRGDVKSCGSKSDRREAQGWN